MNVPTVGKPGFFASLDRRELVLYVFYVLASDRFGMSFYGDQSIARLTSFAEDELCGRPKNGSAVSQGQTGGGP